MIYSFKIDGVQRPPVTVQELGALIERGEFKPGDSLIGPGLEHWATGAEAAAHLHRIFPGRLPPAFGTPTAPPRRPGPPAKPMRSGCQNLVRIGIGLVILAALMALALFLLLYGLCGGFR
jgi:hypothetical protein